MKAKKIKYYPPAVTVPYIQWTGENEGDVNYFLSSRSLGSFSKQSRVRLKGGIK